MISTTVVFPLPVEPTKPTTLLFGILKVTAFNAFFFEPGYA
jgi:hypothetical protein